MFRADGAGSDQECRDADIGAYEDAEPFAKKRVAFKDDLVDDTQKANYRTVNPPAARRSVSATPQSPPHDDLSATPTGTNVPPRATRFGSRGRPSTVGAAGRRPLAR